MSSPPATNTADITRLWHQLAASQAVVEELLSKKCKRSNDNNIGHGLARLISTFDTIQMLVDEADRRLTSKHDELDEIYSEEVVSEEIVCERRHLFTGYTILLNTVPKIRKLLEDPDNKEDLKDFIRKLQKSSEEGRCDDLHHIHEKLPTRLNQIFSPPVAFSDKKNEHGLSNDITGRLLCPITHDWEDECIRKEIHNFTIPIHNDYFLRCFYPKAKGNAGNLENRFLRSALLVMAYCAIFTAPKSADAINGAAEGEDGPDRKHTKADGEKKPTRTNVAKLIGLTKVTPRSITHVAVVLVFSLSGCESWRETYNGFSFPGLYNFIVNFFEDVSDDATRRSNERLLSWWNNQVFPERAAHKTDPQASGNRLKEQRAKHAHTPDHN